MITKTQALMLECVMALEPNAYGVPVRQMAEKRLGRLTATGTVYSALNALEDRQMVSHTDGDPTPQRGGRAKRFWWIEEAGAAALAEFQQAQNDPQKETP